VDGLFSRLVAASSESWRAYTKHDFVLLLARGELPEACFRRYLIQDYLFLIHFARAWGLAIYKSDTLGEIRRAQRLVAATLDVEIDLHIEYSRGWGLSEAAMIAEPEAIETIAYTRFVLDRVTALRDSGAAVLYISSELEEVLAISDRIAVLAGGGFAGVCTRREADLRQIGLWMSGRAA